MLKKTALYILKSAQMVGLGKYKTSPYSLLAGFLYGIMVNPTAYKTMDIFDEDSQKDIEEMTELLDVRSDIEEYQLDADYALNVAIEYAKTDDPLTYDRDTYEQAMKSFSANRELTVVFKLLMDSIYFSLVKFDMDDEASKISFYDGLDEPNEDYEDYDPLEESSDGSESADEADSTDGNPGGKGDKNAKPVNRLTELGEDSDKLKRALKKEIYGQNEAIEEFVGGYFKHILLKDVESDNKTARKLPLTFFFFGPPGVGKTYLAELAGKSINRPFKIFTMSDYAEEKSYIDLVGSSPSFKSAQEGQLISYIKNNPNAIILFDEIEKAHPVTLNIFLQILDLGVLTNPYTGRNENFSEAILIFTSNAGKNLYETEGGKLSKIPKNVILDAVAKDINPSTKEPFFSSALISRIMSGNLIMFNNLPSSVLKNIVDKRFDSVAGGFGKKFNYEVQVDNSVAWLLMYHYGNKMDGRVAKSKSGDMLKNEIYEMTGQMIEKPDSFSGVDTIRFSVDTNGADEEIRALFERKTEKVIAIVGDAAVEPAFKDEYIRVIRVNSEEEVKNAAKEASFFAVDPLLGYNDNCENIVSMDDYDSMGIRVFNTLVRDYPDMPVYLFTLENRMPRADINTFLKKGAYGIIHQRDDMGMLASELTDIAETIAVENMRYEFCRKGYVINYETRLVKKDNVMNIEFYGLTKKMSVDSDDKEAILEDAERPDTRFSDVIGAENAKDELRDYIHFLQSPVEYMEERVSMPKGVLLYGPPGTGKTMLARAMAGESGISFISTTAADLMMDGVFAVKTLFKRAKKYAPTIVFIDEIDAIAKVRTGAANVAGVETMLNTLLTEMDGFKQNTARPVFILAATNYNVRGEGGTIQAALDPALMRRFDNKILVDLPNKEERLEFIRRMIRKLDTELLDEAALENVADRTAGKSLSIIKNIINFCVAQAGRAGKKLNNADLIGGLDAYEYGEEKNVTDMEKAMQTAYHEAGHALMTYLEGECPAFITVVSRGDFGGYMQMEQNESKTRWSFDELLGQIRISIAGRVAESIVYGKYAANNTGASDDLKKATNLAMAAIARYGMTEKIVVETAENPAVSPLYPEYMDKADAMIKEQIKRATDTLTSHRIQLDSIAEALCEKRYLTKAEFLKLVEKV